MNTPSTTAIYLHYRAENMIASLATPPSPAFFARTLRLLHENGGPDPDCGSCGGRGCEDCYEADSLARLYAPLDPKDATIATLTEQRDLLKAEVERLAEGLKFYQPAIVRKTERERAASLIRRLGVGGHAGGRGCERAGRAQGVPGRDRLGGGRGARPRREGRPAMLDRDLLDRLTNLAQECREAQPEIAAILYATAGALAAGGDWPYMLLEVVAGHAQKFVNFVSGAGESVS